MPIVVDGLNRRGLVTLWRDLGYKRGCEIGVFDGIFSELMFEIIPDLTLYLVDPYEKYKEDVRYKVGFGNAERTAHERMKDKRTIWIKGRSENVHMHVPNRSLDFVYIDGNHMYDWVMPDIILWGRKVREGGMLSGHDYDAWIRGGRPVKNATDDYTKRRGIKPWYITDRNARDFPGDENASWFWFVE
jgi:hypothetical protein